MAGVVADYSDDYNNSSPGLETPFGGYPAALGPSGAGGSLGCRGPHPHQLAARGPTSVPPAGGQWRGQHFRQGVLRRHVPHPRLRYGPHPRHGPQHAELAGRLQ